MNEHDPFEKTFSHLRETQPPQDVRDANRRAVRLAIEQPAATHWWQRSIAVPLPAMMATAAVLLMSLSIHLMNTQGREEPPGSTDVTKPPAGSDTSATTLLVSNEPQVEYSETQSYLSGIGVVDRKIIYRIKE